MKYEIGSIRIGVEVDAYEDEDGEVTVDGGSTPGLTVSVDLPVNDPIALAIKHLRKVADQLERKLQAAT